MADDDNEPTELPKIFIKELMKAKKIKGKDLAEAINTTEATISRKLSGARGMPLPWLLAFAKALGVHISELFIDPAGEAQKISDPGQIREFLESVDGLNGDNITVLMATISQWMRSKAEQSVQMSPDDQSSLSTGHHESSSSQSRS